MSGSCAQSSSHSRFVDLAHRVSGKRIDDVDRHWHLYSGEQGRDMVEQFVFGDGCIGVGDNIGNWHLSVDLVRSADDGCLEHGRMW